jgi:hypothetical protein
VLPKPGDVINVDAVDSVCVLIRAVAAVRKLIAEAAIAAVRGAAVGSLCANAGDAGLQSGQLLPVASIERRFENGFCSTVALTAAGVRLRAFDALDDLAILLRRQRRKRRVVCSRHYHDGETGRQIAKRGPLQHQARHDLRYLHRIDSCTRHRVPSNNAVVSTLPLDIGSLCPHRYKVCPHNRESRRNNPCPGKQILQIAGPQ